VKTTDDPRTQAQQLLAEGRRDFAADVDALLVELRRFCDRPRMLEIADDSREDALRVLRTFVLEKFDQRLPMKSAADPILLPSRLFSVEAMSSLGWGSDVRDWNRIAAPFVKG
jgi:hypothetical protein